MGAKREDILKLAQEEEDRILLSHLLDKQRQSQQQSRLVATWFLDLRQQQLCSRALEMAGAQGAVLAGGHPQAERRTMVFLPEYWESIEDVPQDGLPFVALEIASRWPTPLTHRDYLGALMGLGIRREMLGDILMQEEGCQLVVMEELGDFICQSLEKVGNASVNCQQIPLDQLEPPQQQVKILRDTVASLRLDAVLTVAFNLSRGDAAEAVRRGMVQVEGVVQQKPDRLVEQGARISLRGKGKAILAQVGGLSKKGRINLEVHRLL